MQVVALVVAIVGVSLSILGLLAVLEVVDLGEVGGWAAPVVGIALSLGAMAWFARLNKKQV